MTLAKEVRECELLPRGYAVAYWRPWSMTGVCYPLGLHLIVSVAHSVWTRLLHARCPEGWETLWRVRFEIGREQGYVAGYTAALRHIQIVKDAQRDPPHSR